MLILISHPKRLTEEIQQVTCLMKDYPALIFHLRKPNFERAAYENYLKQINADFHPRIVIHQHHELQEKFDLKGIHLNEFERRQGIKSNSISTSFHSLEEAKRELNSANYFFCSPVFQSISKKDYLPIENWEIDSEQLREKAVALGGIKEENLMAASKKGFQHIALLGAVWEKPNPIKAFQKIHTKCQENALFV